MDFRIKSNTQRIVFIALLVSQGVILNIIERYMSFPFIVPGAKLGLANLITLTSLFIFSTKDALKIFFLRIFLASFLLGSFSNFIYSFSGGFLSFLGMYLLLKIAKNRVTPIGLSVLGGFLHNVGQLLMACFIIRNIKLMVYLPFLSLLGIFCGIAIGFGVKRLISFLEKLKLLAVV